ncbi:MULTISPECIES: leucine-rich repeat domain-containing protein [unclassified Luteococcus]|uniref:leucine-rich repeat domain-containing protein n=1 Tax=unclassified Luteococcus TaxID=2639923 RepID=UPI00313A8D51
MSTQFRRSTVSALALAGLTGTLLPLSFPAPAQAAPTQPVVRELSARTDVAGGGLTIQIDGEGFGHNPVVSFGQTPATDVQVLSATRLRVRVPAHPAGRVQVTVRADRSTSPVGHGTGFRYVSASGLRSTTAPVAAQRRRVEGAAVTGGVTDPRLVACINDALGRPIGTAVTRPDLARLSQLNCQDRQIQSLAGLRWASNLTRLDLSRNALTDITDVASLRQLQELWLGNNRIASLTPVAPLTHLQVLDARSNRIGSLAPVATATALQELLVDDNQLTDLSAVARLPRIITVEAAFNRIGSLKPLAGRRTLRSVQLWGNQVSDLTPLSGLTGLVALDLAANRVSRVEALSRLTLLQELNLEQNQVRVLGPLRRLTALTSLNLNANQVSDVSPLAGLGKLTWLFLRQNRITDLAPLRGVRAHAIEAQDQYLPLPGNTTGWWPLSVRDRAGRVPAAQGASLGTGILRWPGAGYRSMTFASADQTFSGRVTQRVQRASTERFGDLSGDGWADLYALRAGTLQVHPGSAANLLTPVTVSSAWGNTNWLGRVHDFNGDRQTDLFSRDRDGRLWSWQVVGLGSMSSARQIGKGWSSMRLMTQAGRLAGGSSQHFIAADSTGALYRWTMTPTGLAQRTRIGVGFGPVRTLLPVGDWNRDGRDDLAAIWPNGRMQLFTTTPAGTLTNGRVIGQGWAGLTSVTIAGKLSTGGTLDLVARRPDGRISVWPNRAGTWGSPRTVATGWPANSAVS